ncbi:hypothetical protein AB4Z51_40380 [Bradyrhizobium sp. 2TAF36]|uniref:hypothetical protein n=1 Tax=Bradyrhizobium sp. 2TAF36 TaxID=3233016 RepID=UPI003F919B18
MTKIAKQLTQARADLAAGDQALIALDAEKADALKSSAAFSKWRLAHEEAELERERLGLLVDKLAGELEQEAADAASADLASRRAELEKQSAALARRISEEGGAAAATLVQLAEEARADAEAVEQLNRELPDERRLLHADHIARHRDPAPREDIKETVVDLWTFEQSGEIVGDPDDVVEHSYERGLIRSPMRNVPVVRRRFRQITYLEQGDREWAESLGSVLRLPRFDGPGLLFDRGHAVEPTPRRELVELVPAHGAPAKPVNNEAA